MTSTIMVSATFVAEPLEAPLRWILDEAGVGYTIGFAPYSQVFQQLLTPSSEIARNKGGINVLMIRLEDFIRDQTNSTIAVQVCTRISAELGDAIEQFAKKAAGTLIVCLLSPGPNINPDRYGGLSDATKLLLARLRGMAGIHILDENRIDGAINQDRYDAARDQLAHIPFTEAHFCSVALALARTIHAIRVPPAKVLALDCDNTLWRGVVGEDGVDGINIPTPYAALQNFALRQFGKGILICLVSKNTEADVLEVFERRSDMLLRLEHIVAHRINWLPKHENLRSLAKELNLGMDSFVFLDDNPVECAQVRAELPEVITIQVPSEAAIPNFLENLWTFDKVFTTGEDAKRTQMYRENSARKALEYSVQDINRFLAALDIRIDIDVPTEEEWTRVEQLAQRTNQFNFTTRRRTARELKSMVARGEHVFRVRVSDRFGEYGLVGEIAAVVKEQTLEVDTLLLSCRVLGRGVEHAMLRHLGRLAESSGLKAIALPYIATDRNVPARAFAESVAAEYGELSPDGILYRIPAGYASQITHRPGHDPSEIVQASLGDEKKTAIGLAPEAKDRSERYSRIANDFVSGTAVLKEMLARKRRTRPIGGPAVRPSSSLEAQMLHLWEEVLEIEGLGVEDDYFAVGGTSLLSVKLFAEIARRFGSKLRLATILAAPTVRLLALQLSGSETHARRSIVFLRKSGAHNLFLVHDGFGETLLYLNLARQLPSTISTYGIEPKRLPGIPLAHASIEDMAAFYVEQIRLVQPHGPYTIGGMCAGGVIAYEMAACLRRLGEQIQLVVILDGATPQAVKRAGFAMSHRIGRLEKVLSGGSGSTDSTFAAFAEIAATLVRKAYNALAYEVSAAARKMGVYLRFALMRSILMRNAAWPAMVPQLSVMEIYNSLESRYVPPKMADVPILLVRASDGDGADTPYREIYKAEDLGWRRVAEQLKVVDVIGGHSSMLQQGAVGSLAAALAKQLGAVEAAHVSR